MLAFYFLEGGGCVRRSGQFTVDNLYGMLRNRAYIGVRAFKIKGETKEVKTVWPGIIDELVFHRVGQILTKNRSHLKPLGARKKLPYILSGVTFCQTCGCSMSGKSATGKYRQGWILRAQLGNQEGLGPFQENI